MKTIIHRRQGRRSSRKAKRYKIITNIWSCIATIHIDFGTKSTGNIQCKQYMMKGFKWRAQFSKYLRIAQVLGSSLGMLRECSVDVLYIEQQSQLIQEEVTFWTSELSRSLINIDFGSNTSHAKEQEVTSAVANGDAQTANCTCWLNINNCTASAHLRLLAL